jgi:hypothetical protein
MEEDLLFAGCERIAKGVVRREEGQESAEGR